MEIIVTFSMMFFTSAVATYYKAVGELACIAVGSTVCITSILAGPVLGGSMNPARTIGPALASNNYKGIWVYIIGGQYQRWHAIVLFEQQIDQFKFKFRLAGLTNSKFREPVNIGSDERVSMNEMAEIVLSFVDKKLPIRHIPGPEGVCGRNSDNTLIKEKLGWAPTMRLKGSGLEKNDLLEMVAHLVILVQPSVFCWSY